MRPKAYNHSYSTRVQSTGSFGLRNALDTMYSSFPYKMSKDAVRLIFGPFIMFGGINTHCVLSETTRRTWRGRHDLDGPAFEFGESSICPGQFLKKKACLCPAGSARHSDDGRVL